MRIATRFPVAVHILALLYLRRDRHITSEHIARSVNTNPVVIRRILGMLKQAGLVETRRGVKGAWLRREPSDISLLDIYQAVGAVHDTLFDVHRHPNPQCLVGANIQAALEGTLAAAQASLERTLGSITLAAILDQIVRDPRESEAPLSDDTHDRE